MPQERSAPEQSFIDSKLDEALPEFGLPPNSPLRQILDRDAQVFEGSGITGQKAYGIKVVREGMKDVTVRERLAELSQDFMYRHHFPPQGKAVSSTDLREMAAHFDDIAAGRVVVTK
jgi:hypothetical protein